MSSEPETAPTREQLFATARPIAEAENVFAAVADAMTRRGFVGDIRHIELLYALFTSRLLARPMCAFIKAPSASGKSWLLNRMLEMFPPGSYEVKSGFSPKAIAYGRSDLRHRILAVQESSGLNGREGNMLVRTLISEGCVRWEVAGRQRDGFAAREVTREGPIAFVMTTTLNTMHGEDETRALSILVEDTRQHTKDVIRNICRGFSGELKADADDLAGWHAYQRWLEAGPNVAAIPFAAALGRLIFVRANRAKRDFEQLLTAIAVSALLHQQRRGRDAAGRVVATIDDYAQARRFLERPLNEASGTAIPPGVRSLVEHLLDYSSPVNAYDRDAPCGLTLDDVAIRMDVDKSVASRRVARAKELGLVVDLGSSGRGKPCRLLPMQPLPADWNVLPEPRYVEAETRGGLDALIRADNAADEPRQEALRREATKRAKSWIRRKKAEIRYNCDPPSDWPPPPVEASADAAAAGTDGQAPPAAPEPEAAPAPRPLPPIIANAPHPDQPDGGYRARRPINRFKAAMEERRRG